MPTMTLGSDSVILSKPDHHLVSLCAAHLISLVRIPLRMTLLRDKRCTAQCTLMLVTAYAPGELWQYVLHAASNRPA